jgi:hypothetical protein
MLDSHLYWLTKLRAEQPWRAVRTDNMYGYVPPWEDLRQYPERTVALAPIVIKGKKCWAQIRFETVLPPAYPPELGILPCPWTFLRLVLWTKEQQPEPQEIIAADAARSNTSIRYFIQSRKDMKRFLATR